MTRRRALIAALADWVDTTRQRLADRGRCAVCAAVLPLTDVHVGSGVVRMCAVCATETERSTP